jgi:protein-L-isoaspartate(D-aspartate) O-methyltransferase
MLRLAGIEDAAVERAMAAVKREDFLGPPPWTVVDPGVGTTVVAGDERAPLYEDVLIVLDAARGVNNGSPSLHALMLHHLGVRPGERVLHIGTGGGYYTAVLAELAGPEGRVTGIEFDAGLAAASAANLQSWPNVTVRQGDGAEWPREEVDRIYVNFAVADPVARWTDALSAAGSLVFPLGVPPVHAPPPRRHSGHGAVLAFTRQGGGIAVRFVSLCGFVCAEGPLAGARAHQEALAAAFARGGVERVRSYHRPPPARAEGCWFAGTDWALAFDRPAAA